VGAGRGLERFALRRGRPGRPILTFKDGTYTVVTDFGQVAFNQDQVESVTTKE
jgi:hypothetical protein